MEKSTLKKRTLSASLSDVFLAALVLMVVAMMIIPLPTQALDFLIASNVSFSILVLLIALYLKKPLSFSSFPTLLLITTLFRLGLNVSSTRLILLQADAGEVIQSFGQFVVQGNYVVGAVVFLLITLVQFMVIAKGSERVAEVGARFALDALPGKQMGIDSDLRSENITQETAIELRDSLQQESQFYGAMDGAMKFVKGDAIAALVISAINILGGLIVGILFFELSLSESIKTFSLLTIGDGLVSQIPSLLISTSAGLVITRVSSEKKPYSLGQEIISQIIKNPTPLKAVSFFIFALAWFPGIPFLPFAILAVLTFSLALFLEKNPPSITHDDSGFGKQTDDSLAPLHIQIDPTFAESLKTTNNRFQLDQHIHLFKHKILQKYGVPISEISVETKPSASEKSYAIFLHGMLIAEGTAENQKLLVLAPPNKLSPIGLKGHLGADPLNGSPATWVDISQIQIIQQNKLPHLSTAEIIFRHLEKALLPKLHKILGIQETKILLRNLESNKPDLVKEVVPKLISIPHLTHLLRRLLMEKVSIQPLEEILNTLSIHRTLEEQQVSILKMTERVRQEMQEILIKDLQTKQVLKAFNVDPEIEEMLQDYLHTATDSQKYRIPKDIQMDIQRAIRNTVNSTSQLQHIFLCQPEMRRCLWEITSEVSSSIVVLSHDEVPSSVTIQPLGTFSISSSLK